VTAAWGAIGFALHLLTRNWTPDPRDEQVAILRFIALGSGLKFGQATSYEFNKAACRLTPDPANHH